MLRTVFLDPDAREVYPDLEAIAAADTVAALRAAVGPDLDDAGLTDLVGEFSFKSEEFRRLWGAPRRARQTHTTRRRAVAARGRWR